MIAYIIRSVLAAVVISVLVRVAVYAVDRFFDRNRRM